MLSKACEYGIRAMLYIASKTPHGERTRLKEIANKVGAPEAFTAKVLQNLVKNGILLSTTGPKGGFYIEPEKADSLKLIEIVKAIDGDRLFKGCGLGLKECDDEKPCPVHYEFKKVRDELEKMFSNMSVGELARDVGDEIVFLRR